MLFKIGGMAEVSGVSVRTLRYYDEVGLLKPANVNEAGYRFYTERDLERLQQILFYRTLDFGLEEIREILDRPGFDRRKALKEQKKLLIERRKDLDEVIRTIEKTIAFEGGVKKMSRKEMFRGFDMKAIEEHRARYADETRSRFGHTDAYKESQKRTKKYTKADWARIMNRGKEIYARIADLMDRPVSDKEVQGLVGEWRDHISENFYNCTVEIFRGLGEMYVQDERFTENIDKTRTGLARYLSRAIQFYCDRKETP